MEKEQKISEENIKKILAPPKYCFKHYIKQITNKQEIEGIRWRLENYKEENFELLIKIKRKIRTHNKIELPKKNLNES